MSNIYGDTEEREITDWYKNILSHSTINIHARVEKIEFDFAGLEFGIDLRTLLLIMVLTGILFWRYFLWL